MFDSMLPMLPFTIYVTLRYNILQVAHMPTVVCLCVYSHFDPFLRQTVK